MKKIISLALTFMMIMYLVACGGEKVIQERDESAEYNVKILKGNYSEYECEESNCDNPPIYQIYSEYDLESYYYCKEHYDSGSTTKKYNEVVKDVEEHEQWLSDYGITRRESNEHDGEKQCKVCKRYFKMGTDDSWSITKTNMCEQCYKNYKYANELKDEMTK